jgi:hypothetical protein
VSTSCSYLGDLTVPLLGVDRCVEVKVRGNGFGQLYAWLEPRDLLIVRADRRRLDFRSTGNHSARRLFSLTSLWR